MPSLTGWRLPTIAQIRRAVAASAVALAVTWTGHAEAQPPAYTAVEAGFSGVVINPGQTMPTNQVGFVQVSATWVLPASLPGAACDAGYAYYKRWISLQRTGSDVLQAGFVVAVPCNGGPLELDGFFNWYLCPGGGCMAYSSPQAQHLSASPRDTIEAYVWVTPDGLGHAWLGDVTAGATAGGDIKSPFLPGSPAVEPCCVLAEWIVEGGTLGTGATAPYRQLVMLDAWAVDSQGQSRAPTDPGVGTYLIREAGGTSSATMIGDTTVRFWTP